MNWPRAIFLVLESIWLFCAAACAAAAVLAIVRKDSIVRFEAAFRSLDERPVARWAPAALLGLLPAGFACLYKTAEHATYLLGADSAGVTNVVWNFIHGYGWTSSILTERSYFAIHFAVTTAFLAPLLLVWPSILALVLVQAALIGSTIWGVYRLSILHCRMHWAGWCAALLAWSCFLFRETMIADLNNTPLAFPAFIWAAYCWESRKPWPGAILALVYLTTREQAPFLFVGVGALLALTGRRGHQRLAGLGLSVLSVGVWLLEMRLIRHSQPAQADHAVNFWGYYAALGDSPLGLIKTALLRPWLYVKALVVPPSQLWTPARAFVSLALLPLLSGVAIVPALAVWLPQQLAPGGSPFHALEGHYAGLLIGPLIWSMVHGLRAFLEIAPVSWRRFVACGMMSVAAASFVLNSGFLPDPTTNEILEPWRADAPGALGQVPPGASVWADDLLAQNLATRRFVKTMPFQDDVVFLDGLFVPDRVILSRRWLALSSPGFKTRVLSCLKERRFAKIFQNDSFIVLANPAPAPAARPEKITLK